MRKIEEVLENILINQFKEKSYETSTIIHCVNGNVS